MPKELFDRILQVKIGMYLTGMVKWVDGDPVDKADYLWREMGEYLKKNRFGYLSIRIKDKH